jgi:hypothetical protein
MPGETTPHLRGADQFALTYFDIQLPPASRLFAVHSTLSLQVSVTRTLISALTIRPGVTLCKPLRSTADYRFFIE